MNKYTLTNKNTIISAQQFDIPSTGLPEGWPVSTFDPRAVQPGDWIVTADYESDNPAYFVVPQKAFDLMFTPMETEIKLDADGAEIEVQVAPPVDDLVDPTALPSGKDTSGISSGTSSMEQPSEKTDQDSTQLSPSNNNTGEE